MVFQSYALYPNMNVENIFGSQICATFQNQRETKVERLNASNISPSHNVRRIIRRSTSTRSYGKLYPQARLFLFDEP